MNLVKKVTNELMELSSETKKEVFGRFFKTGKGEYGEGDIFIGLTSPQIQGIARAYYKDLSLSEIEIFLRNEIHEFRMFALTCMVYRYQKGKDTKEKETLFKLYLKNTKHINNWDLVDVSCPKIVGMHLLDKERSILYELAKSKDLWEQRISIMATFAFIRNNEFEDALKISEILLNHKHDLIHKAVGWMLKEIGNRNLEVEEKFLEQRYKTMPRTMLRYAIEKFEESKRQAYLKGEI